MSKSCISPFFYLSGTFHRSLRVQSFCNSGRPLWPAKAVRSLCNALQKCSAKRHIPNWSVGTGADGRQVHIALWDLPHGFVELLSVKSGSLFLRHSCRFTSRATTNQGGGNFCPLSLCSRTDAVRSCFPTKTQKRGGHESHKTSVALSCKPAADMQKYFHLRLNRKDPLSPPFWLQGAPSGP